MSKIPKSISFLLILFHCLLALVFSEKISFRPSLYILTIISITAHIQFIRDRISAKLLFAISSVQMISFIIIIMIFSQRETFDESTSVGTSILIFFHTIALGILLFLNFVIIATAKGAQIHPKITNKLRKSIPISFYLCVIACIVCFIASSRVHHTLPRIEIAENIIVESIDISPKVAPMIFQNVYGFFSLLIPMSIIMMEYLQKGDNIKIRTWQAVIILSCFILPTLLCGDINTHRVQNTLKWDTFHNSAFQLTFHLSHALTDEQIISQLNQCPKLYHCQVSTASKLEKDDCGGFYTQQYQWKDITLTPSGGSLESTLRCETHAVPITKHQTQIIQGIKDDSDLNQFIPPWTLGTTITITSAITAILQTIQLFK